MRRQSLIAFGLACLLVGLAAYLLGRRFAAAPRPSAPPAPSTAASETPEPEADRPLSFDELAALLAARKGESAAAAFGREFMSRPRLKRIYDEFAREAARSRARQVPGPTAQDFVRELKAQPDFGALVTQASKDASLRAMAEDLARRPGVTRALRAAAEKPSRPGAAAPGPRVFGVSAPAAAPGLAGNAAAGPDGSGATFGVAAPHGVRRAADPRIEGHWVHDNGPADFMAVCRMLGPAEDCRRALAECGRDRECSSRVSAIVSRGYGGVAGSTAPAHTPSHPPAAKDRPDARK